MRSKVLCVLAVATEQAADEKEGDHRWRGPDGHVHVALPITAKDYGPLGGGNCWRIVARGLRFLGLFERDLAGTFAHT